jgi:glycosyltransferase involved in cell wall biosynthesis
MRILIFTQQLAAFRSGVGTYAYGLVYGLLERGHQVTAVIPEGEEIEFPGIKLISVPRPRFDPTPGGWIALGRSFAKVLKDQAKDHDIAHVTDAREAWKIKNPTIPVTGMANDSYALDWLENDYPHDLFVDKRYRRNYYRFLRRAEGWTYPRLKALIANSSHVAKAIAAGYGLSADQITVINYGLPEQPEVPQIHLDGNPSILFVGGNFQRKGLPVLLEAASKLKSHFPDIRIHVVGRDRNQAALESKASQMGVREAVKFHGWQPNDQVRGMMAGADIFSLPSLTEGFGLVYLEAMVAGTPVIATSLGGASEVFNDGEEALFVHPTDVAGLAQAIENLAGNRQMRTKLIAGGKKAADRFSVEAQAEKTEELFLRVLKEGSVRQ